MNKIEDIIKEIKRLENDLLEEMQRKESEFYYRVKGKKIFFEEEARKYQKKFVIKASEYISKASLANLMTVPFIWSCIIPAILLDLSVSIYQFICFRIYDIPKVKRGKYIIIDRRQLKYLNIIEKINCFYCEYFNGLIAYIQEIAARTEQYWCPIKHARRITTMHSRYYKFLEYGDCENFHEKLEALRKDFDDLKNQ